mmetsp:Transcript_30477/g.89788  ORF Transcript_30477/g.89788 Transcript_30477/m.89788 type:complete len:117 (-) Transcript_30477:861-1211(-)
MPKHLYHYTDKDSIHKIATSGELRPSTDTRSDCALGPGVYFTSKPPQSSNSTLLTNNYDGAASSNAHKVAAYVRIDADKVNYRSGKDELGRDVYVVPGNGVDLTDKGAVGGYRKRY